jgi:hypothetical protein
MAAIPRQLPAMPAAADPMDWHEEREAAHQMRSGKINRISSKKQVLFSIF